LNGTGFQEEREMCKKTKAMPFVFVFSRGTGYRRTKSKANFKGKIEYLKK
jgi:hypothetical protein